MQFLIYHSRSWLTLLLLVLACQTPTREPIYFSAFPYLGQGAEEGWLANDSIVIKNGIFNPGITPHPWWIKTTFTNPQNQSARYFLVFNNPHINRLQVYLNGSDSVLFTMGDKFPFRERIYQDRDFVIPLILEGGESADILVLVDKAGETLLLEPEILDEHEFWDKKTKENLLVGVIIGWMLIVFLFAVFYSLELKEWSALFYALYILAILFWLISHWGLGFQFLWPGNITWAGKSRPYFNIVTNVLLLLVILSFFPHKNQGKIIGRFLWVILIALSILLIPASFNLESSISVSGKMLFLYITFSVSILITILVLWYLTIQWRANVLFAGFYLAGVLVLLFFTILIQVHQTWLDLGIPYFLFSFGSGLGLMGETTLITIAFAKKSAAYKKEKENLTIQIKEQETELQLQKAEVALKALKAQINPHFIFNCLNSIHHYMYKHPVSEAGQYLLKFSQQIRYVLESSERKTVPLVEELEANRIYLELEQLRLNHSFDFSITVENGVYPETMYIPPMLIQPFLENAVWHGVAGGGKIEVNISQLNDSHLQCEIQDENTNHTQLKIERNLSEQVKKTSMGMNLMQERFDILNQLNGKNSGYTLEDRKDGIPGKVLRIRIPFED